MHFDDSSDPHAKLFWLVLLLASIPFFLDATACYDPHVRDACEADALRCNFVDPVDVTKLPGLGLPNSYTCRCSCGHDTNDDDIPDEDPTSQDLQVCMPEALNPNLPLGDPRGGEPTNDELNDDCQDRVQENLEEIAQECIESDFDPNDFDCKCAHSGTAERWVEACDQDVVPGPPHNPCPPAPLASDCGNFDPQNGLKEATHDPDLEPIEPVCLAESSDPDVPVANALAGGIFGRVTTCSVEGTVDVALGGEEASPGAFGTLFFTGEPCPGEECDVGVYYKLDVNNFTLEGGFRDLDEANFTQMRHWGASVPGAAALTGGGEGHFDSDELLTNVRAVVQLNPLIGDAFNEQASALVRNDDAVQVGVDWAGHTCSLEGAALGLDGFAVHLMGTIVNEPPQADAGADQSVDCASAAGTDVMLDGSASSDPEGNIRLHSWRKGGRAGEQVGITPMVDVSLALDESAEYFLTVVDELGQASHDSTEVGVADETAPAIECNAPATITPPEGVEGKGPVSFTATLTDLCDAAPQAMITDYDCFQLTKSGKRVDKTEDCMVAIDGAMITILDSGGVGDHIQWTVQSSDASGNEGTLVCAVLVVRP